jgi:REP element-mobilizing transposase RayT
MWNDTDIPLAVFFTFRCYGTWLHGDERGSVDRHHNVYGTSRISLNKNWKNYNQAQLDRPPIELRARQRKVVEQGVRELCQKRDWQIFAINVRTNHVHAVIDIKGKDSARALAAIKAGATKRLREQRLWNMEETPWAEKGSRSKLWNVRSIAEAVDYVLNRQGNELPKFDWW